MNSKPVVLWVQRLLLLCFLGMTQNAPAEEFLTKKLSLREMKQTQGYGVNKVLLTFERKIASRTALSSLDEHLLKTLRDVRGRYKIAKSALEHIPKDTPHYRAAKLQTFLGVTQAKKDPYLDRIALAVRDTWWFKDSSFMSGHPQIRDYRSFKKHVIVGKQDPQAMHYLDSGRIAFNNLVADITLDGIYSGKPTPQEIKSLSMGELGRLFGHISTPELEAMKSYMTQHRFGVNMVLPQMLPANPQVVTKADLQRFVQGTHEIGKRIVTYGLDLDRLGIVNRSKPLGESIMGLARIGKRLTEGKIPLADIDQFQARLKNQVYDFLEGTSPEFRDQVVREILDLGETLKNTSSLQLKMALGALEAGIPTPPEALTGLQVLKAKFAAPISAATMVPGVAPSMPHLPPGLGQAASAAPALAKMPQPRAYQAVPVQMRQPLQ